jgi:hypothetical protein
MKLFIQANKFILTGVILSLFTLGCGYYIINQPNQKASAQSPSGASPIETSSPTIIVPTNNTSSVLVANEVPQATSTTIFRSSAISIIPAATPSTPDVSSLITPLVSSSLATSNSSSSIVSSINISKVNAKINKNGTPRSGGSDWAIWTGSLLILSIGIYLQYRSKTVNKLVTDEKEIK